VAKPAGFKKQTGSIELHVYSQRWMELSVEKPIVQFHTASETQGLELVHSPGGKDRARQWKIKVLVEDQ
jgi:hypothetical protein